MRIDKPDKPATPEVVHVDPLRRAPKGRASNTHSELSAAPADSASLSEAAKLSAAREAHVEQLRRAVECGEYDASPEKVADAIITEHLADSHQA